MTDAAGLRELRDTLGESAVFEHDGVGLDGVQLGLTLAPQSPEALGAALAVCTRRKLPVIVRGGGSGLGRGNGPRPADAWLSTSALETTCEVDADEGVARFSAATPVAELDEAARAAGWRSPIEAVGPLSTLGGAIAVGADGPRTPGLGRMRRVVLGLDVVLASGAQTTCGSRVVKNVSGYDLVKLYVGSLGSLGVLTGGWLRLCPAPKSEESYAVRIGPEGFALALEAARRPGVRAVAWVDAALAPGLVGPEEEDILLVELAGDAPVVAETTAWLRAAAEVVEAPGAIDRLHARLVDPATAPLRFRFSAPCSRLSGLHDRLEAGGAHCVIQPGNREAFAFFSLEREDGALVDRAWRTVRAAADPAEGIHAILEQAPGWAKDGRDVFSATGSTLPLMRALKAQYDPDGILNPGRYAGGL